MLKRTIFSVGQRLRNPSITPWLKFLKASDQWTIEHLEQYQLEKLQELVQFAYRYAPFYREKFDALGLKPEDIQSLEDVQKLPTLTRKDLVQHNQEIHTEYHFHKTFRAITSGSTGDSLVFQRDESADSFNRAAIFRGYSWYDIQPWERNGYFWGFDFNRKKRLKTKVLDALQNRFRIFNYEEKAFRRFVQKLRKASYIHGYSSAVFHTAKLINELYETSPVQLKMVKGTSEKIYDSYQEEVQKAFGVKMVSEYGATESGIVAFECPEGHMHINMEGVLVEEEEGEILITNLQMKSFPLIRYRLGDYVTLAPKEKKCACGRAHHIIEDITGRIGLNVYGIEKIYPSFTFYYIFKNLGNNHNLKLTYQVIQQTKGTLDFYVEEALDAESQLLVKQEIEKYFGNDMRYTLTQNHRPSQQKKKKKSFISYI